MNEEMTTQTEETEGLEQESKTYSEEEMMSLVQSESDKRVQQALKTQQKKFEKELAKHKSLSELDAEQRANAEKEMKIAELQEKLEEYKLATTKTEIAKVLSNRCLDANLVDFVVSSTDTDECIANIDKLDRIFKMMVKNEVEKRMNTSTPRTSTTGLDGAISKEQFAKMSISEQVDLYKNNPDLYMQLVK